MGSDRTMGTTGMSTLAQALVSWEEFLTLPERPENRGRYELHDGAVVIVAAPRPIHIKLQKQTERLRSTGRRTCGRHDRVPVSSASNAASQRLVALSAGTQEFWAEDWDQCTVEVTNLKGTTIYRPEERIPIALFDGAIETGGIFLV